jgi:hypothetical protein
MARRCDTGHFLAHLRSQPERWSYHGVINLILVAGDTPASAYSGEMASSFAEGVIVKCGYVVEILFPKRTLDMIFATTSPQI